jgi:hypothetical protein
MAPKLADVLPLVLEHVRRLPPAWFAGSFVGVDPLRGPPASSFSRMLEVWELIDERLVLPSAEVSAALDAGLRTVAARGDFARFAMSVARTCRACRAAVNALAPARAARVAQAQALHDTARALRETSFVTATEANNIALGLAALCAAETENTAEQWQDFSSDFTQAALVPMGILLARRIVELPELPEAGISMVQGFVIRTFAAECAHTWVTLQVKLAQQGPAAHVDWELFLRRAAGRQLRASLTQLRAWLGSFWPWRLLRAAS